MFSTLFNNKAIFNGDFSKSSAADVFVCGKELNLFPHTTSLQQMTLNIQVKTGKISINESIIIE